MPAIDENGDITYAGYTSTGYKIFLIEKRGTEVKRQISYVWEKSSA